MTKLIRRIPPWVLLVAGMCAASITFTYSDNLLLAIAVGIVFVVIEIVLLMRERRQIEKSTE